MTMTVAETGLPPVISVGDTQYFTEPLYGRDQIQDRVDVMGADLAERYANQGNIHMLTVLSGAIPFAADLRRSMARANPDLDITTDEMKVKSYAGAAPSGTFRVLLKPTIPVEGRNVLVTEDVLDSGMTLNWIVNYLKGKGAASVEVAVALKKRVARQADIVGQAALHSAFEVGEQFVVGYGLDLDERYRELDGMVQLRPIPSVIPNPRV